MITRKIKGLDRQLAKLRRFPAVFQRDVRELLRREARSLVSSSGNVPGLVQVTPPHNRMRELTGTKAKKRGEQKVQSDVRRVLASAAYAYDTIKTKSRVAASAFWFLIKHRQYQQAQQILREHGYNVRLRNAQIVARPDLSLHQKSRRRGNVPKTMHAKQVVVNYGPVNSYVRKVKRRVGMLASAPAAAVGTRYGALRGVPAWVARHRSRWGVAYERKTPHGILIVLGTAAPFVVNDLQRRFNYVLQYRLKALRRQLPYVIRAVEKRLTRQMAQS